ncbi:MAG: twin transmembrane helix small protein [Pseudomonadota bacterium]
MFIKLLIIGAFFTIIYSLGSGLYFLMKDEPGSGRIARALTWRIALSIALFVLILLGVATGLIQPHGLLPPSAAG